MTVSTRATRVMGLIPTPKAVQEVERIWGGVLAEMALRVEALWAGVVLWVAHHLPVHCEMRLNEGRDSTDQILARTTLPLGMK